MRLRWPSDRLWLRLLLQEPTEAGVAGATKVTVLAIDRRLLTTRIQLQAAVGVTLEADGGTGGVMTANATLGAEHQSAVDRWRVVGQPIVLFQRTSWLLALLKIRFHCCVDEEHG